MLVLGCSQENEKPTVNKAASNTLFNSISSIESGITFSNVVEEKYENFFEFFMYVYNGGGVSVGDINKDGLPDIYFTGNEIPNKLYLNKGGLKFEDITETAGVAGDSNWDNGVSMIDINNDGYQDIYVCRGGWQDTDEGRQNLLYVNNGDLTFTEKAKEYGLADTGYSMQASFFDFDNDNDLDVYLINRPDSFALPLTQTASLRHSPPEVNRDKFYVNENGKFLEQGKERGLGVNYGYGLSVVAADLNDDDYADLFISNDFSVEDYYFINQGDGTFKQSIQEVTNHIAMYSMGTDITDINNDGREDIVVMEMRPYDYVRSKVSMPMMNVQSFHDIISADMHKQYMHNMLFLNQGDHFFSDISQYAGMSKTDWSWSVLSSDLDNDGLRDLFITNGMKRDFFDGDVQLRMQEYVENNRHLFQNAEQILTEGFAGIINSYRPIKIKNYLFKNTGNYAYKDVSKDWGIRASSFSNGSAVADFDNDGDLDLIVNNFDDPAFLLENTASDKTNHIIIDLQGPESNVDGLGAKTWVYAGGQSQFFQNKTVRGYLSSSDPRVHFGLGNSTQIDSVVVKWTDGRVSITTDIQANKIIEISYDSSKDRSDSGSFSNPIFHEVTDQFQNKPFVHKENEFDEYEIQTLLPHMFSKGGPFISVADVNGDGKEDYFIGGAAGQSGQLYIQGDKRFYAQSTHVFGQDIKFEDMSSAFIDVDGDSDLDLVVVSGGSEFPEGDKLYRDRIYYNDGRGNFTKRKFLPSTSSGSCVAPYDMDGDGDLDLFIGGQVIANNYLFPPTSYLLVNEGGEFVDRTEELAPQLKNVGMVSSAAWTDIDGGGSKELVVVGEWMPIQVYSWVDGVLQQAKDYPALENSEGWWNKVVAYDMDNDGDEDLILGNLGTNYKFKASEKKPFEVYASDFDRNGTNDIFLAKEYKSKIVPVRGKECTSGQVPAISRKFPTFTSFAYADLSQIIGQGLESAAHKEARLFSSIILENDNGKLVRRTLPPEAQFSTLLGVTIDDYNNDGILDMLIAGNKFDVEIETTAADASPGYLLLGVGELEYKAVDPMESGFFIPYNVKDIKSIDVDGVPLILVGVNDDKIRAFKRR